MINSVFRTGKNYYPQVFLEGFKYLGKKRLYYITVDIEISSDNSDKEDSNKENFHKESFNKEN